jgi:hypothetical protein
VTFSKDPVLDLNQVPEDQWVRAVEPFHPSTHSMSLDELRTGRIQEAMVASVRPTQLASLLVVRGVDQILREAKPRG